MRKVYCFFILIVTILIFPVGVRAEVAGNAGFVNNPIWYSPDSFLEGDSVSIYTFLFNPGPGILSGEVEFYDKNVVLATRPFSLAKNTAEEISAKWKVTAGDHTISAKIINAKMTTNGKTEPIVLSNNTTSVDKRFVPKKVVEEEKKEVVDNTSNTLIEKTDIAVSEKVATLPFLKEVESFREDNAESFSEDKIKAKETVELLSEEKNGVIQKNKKDIPPSQIPNYAQRPLAYISLFFYSILSYIFHHPIAFYGVLILIAFFIFRFLYRLIRG